MKNILFLFLGFLFFSCVSQQEDKEIINYDKNTVIGRFDVPKGFKRIKSEPNSFAYYLQNLKLKPKGAIVKTYNGDKKISPDVYCAVVDMDIGDKNLQQCADAVMRLRAEYLFKLKEFDKIHFNFTNGFRVDYSKWREGNRIKVNGNQTSWIHTANPDTSYKSFRKYMDWIFMYAGSLSLSKELKPVNYSDMQIGDVLIHGGSPGHAVIVVDMAENYETGEKLYMLAQSYMPAQDIQILVNNNDTDISPWYKLDTSEETIETPEWEFYTNELKRF